MFNALIKPRDIACLRGVFPVLLLSLLLPVLLGVASIWLTMGPMREVLAGLASSMFACACYSARQAAAAFPDYLL